MSFGINYESLLDVVKEYWRLGMETMFYSASVSILNWDLKGATAVEG